MKKVHGSSGSTGRLGVQQGERGRLDTKGRTHINCLDRKNKVCPGMKLDGSLLQHYTGLLNQSYHFKLYLHKG